MTFVASSTLETPYAPPIRIARHFSNLSFGSFATVSGRPHSAVMQSELEEDHERRLHLARNLAPDSERSHCDLVTTF